MPIKSCIFTHNLFVPGTLELVVTTSKTSVRAEVSARSRGLYDVTFVPQDVLPHYINITFNDEHIGLSPFCCQVHYGSPAKDQIEEEKTIVVGKPSFFEIDIEDAFNESWTLKDPFGKSCKIEEMHGKGKIR